MSEKETPELAQTFFAESFSLLRISVCEASVASLILRFNVAVKLIVLEEEKNFAHVMQTAVKNVHTRFQAWQETLKPDLKKTKDIEKQIDQFLKQLFQFITFRNEQFSPLLLSINDYLDKTPQASKALKTIYQHMMKFYDAFDPLVSFSQPLILDSMRREIEQEEAKKNFVTNQRGSFFRKQNYLFSYPRDSPSLYTDSLPHASSCLSHDPARRMGAIHS